MVLHVKIPDKRKRCCPGGKAGDWERGQDSKLPRDLKQLLEYWCLYLIFYHGSICFTQSICWCCNICESDHPTKIQDRYEHLKGQNIESRKTLPCDKWKESRRWAAWKHVKEIANQSEACCQRTLTIATSPTVGKLTTEIWSTKPPRFRHCLKFLSMSLAD